MRITSWWKQTLSSRIGAVLSMRSAFISVHESDVICLHIQYSSKIARRVPNASLYGSVVINIHVLCASSFIIYSYVTPVPRRDFGPVRH